MGLIDIVYDYKIQTLYSLNIAKVIDGYWNYPHHSL